VLAVDDLALPAQRPLPAATNTPATAVGTSLESVEREHLLQALHASNWNVTQAARTLDISRDTLRYRMERHGLQR
jgi:transcriptional regulator of acetoin/glycerol metabolism